MTFFDHIKDNSTLTVGTAFEHVQNPSGSGGVTTYLPKDSFTADITTEVSADLAIQELSGDLSTPVLSADITEYELDGDIKNEIEGDLDG